MTTAIVAFGSAFVVGTAVTYAMRYLAPRIGAVDMPDGYRKIHTRAIPYLGGIGVFAGFLFPVVLLMTLFRHLVPARHLLGVVESFTVILAGASIALVMGAWDDIRGMRPRVKLLFQVMAALVAMAGGQVIHRLSLPFVGEVSLGYWGIPLTMFWYLGCMNAINLLDGMDGLAGGVSLIVCITMAVVGMLMGNWLGMLLMASLAGGILGFLVHNFHPARIFLGDSGSNVIGFLIAALALMTSRKRETAVALLVPVLALGVPIIDTGLAIVRRWSRNLPLSAPDRRHIHHLLLSLGMSQRRAVMVIYAISVVLCLGAVIGINSERELLMMVFGVMGLLVFVCVRVLGAVQLSELAHRFTRDWQRRQTENVARIELERCAHFLPHADSLDALWNGCLPALELMGVDDARMELQADHQPRREWAWRSGACANDPHAAPDCWRVRLQVMAGNQVVGHIVLGGILMNGNGCATDRADMIWRLRDLISSQLPRLFMPAPVPSTDVLPPVVAAVPGHGA